MTFQQTRFLLAAGLLCGATLIGTVAPSSAAVTGDKVTICHAAGRDGTDKYVTLEVSVNAVYKEQGGHFFENGTPRAGHEDDYFGACKVTVTTTVPDETTTTVAESTTTTVDGSTTTVPATVPAPKQATVPATPTTTATGAPRVELPHTGLSGTEWMAMAGLSLVLLGSLILLSGRKPDEG